MYTNKTDKKMNVKTSVTNLKNLVLCSPFNKSKGDIKLSVNPKGKNCYCMKIQHEGSISLSIGGSSVSF